VISVALPVRNGANHLERLFGVSRHGPIKTMNWSFVTVPRRIRRRR
jgi:hypothetical protein